MTPGHMDGSPKRSLVLDLERADGRVALARLAAASDVLIETAPAGAMDRAGIGYEALATRHPGPVFTSITPFGQTGPWRGRLTSDMVAALAGMVYVNRSLHWTRSFRVARCRDGYLLHRHRGVGVQQILGY
jgi:crotonobetainyl-CoA:carnitine CoA-transferase CaiB-like acyl-CoA transferase